MKKVYDLNGEFSNRDRYGRMNKSAKRVDVVSVRLVKESSFLYKKRRVGSPDDAYKIFKDFLEDLDREVFVVMSLDTKNQPLTINVAHIGNLNSSIVSPACVLRVAILSSANSIMVAHNHPSGDTEPSKADISVTQGLKEASELMGINFLDHLIIGDESYLSLREEGVLGDE